MASSLDEIVRKLGDEIFNILRKRFGDRWEFAKQKNPFPYQALREIRDSNKSITKPKKEDFLQL